MTNRHVWPLLVLSVLLTGCMSSDMHVAVKADGSGTVTHTVKASKTAWSNFDAMAAAAGDPSALKETRRLTISEEDVRRVASMIGRDVTMISSTSISGGDIEGRTTVYAFNRPDDLHLSFVPPGPGMLNYYIGIEGVGLAPGTRPATHLEFELTSPEPGRKLLTVRFPDQRFDPSSAPITNEPRPKNTPEETALLQGFVKGARIELTVEPVTKLLRTNSPHREGNRVTLMSLDIEKMALSDEIDELWGFRPASFDELRWAIHDLPGATLSIDREVTIEFEATEPQPAAAPAAQPPDTEIFLASLSMRDGKLIVGTPVNITNNPGYDNQPSFTPDGRSILFTSARAGTPDAPQMDVFRYDIADNRIVRVTSTPESEYSPAITPDGKHIAVVRVEADGTQRLWRFLPDGSNPSLVFRDVRPVGYHAWASDRTVAMFVLGKPATLQVGDPTSAERQTVASNIGRSLQRTPDGAISFVALESQTGSEAHVAKLERQSNGRFAAVSLVRRLPGADELYVSWMPDGTLLAAHKGVLYGWRQGDADWKPLATLELPGFAAVSRLAVSPAADRLAVVAQKQ